MSFLEDIASKELGSMLGNSSNPLPSWVIEMINNQPGGLSGLVEQFHDKGLGGLVSSWVGTGQNLPVSADQIQHVLGSEQVKELAAKVGISPEICGSHLSQLLPLIVDQLTPNGQVSPTASGLESGLNLLEGRGKTGTDA